MDKYFYALCAYGLFLILYFSVKYKFSPATLLVLGFVAMAICMLANLLGFFTAVHKTV